MYVLGGLILGAAWGAFGARRRGGRALDMAQWAAAFGLIFAVLGMALTVLLNRLYAG